MPQVRSQSVATLGLAIIVASVAILVADIFSPLGIAVWILYLAPTALCLFAWRAAIPLICAATNTVFLILGTWLSPGTFGPYTILNRSFGAIAMWSLAIVAYRYILSRQSLQRFAWSQTGLLQTTMAMRGTSSANSAANAALRALVNFTGAKVGVLYLMEQGHLRRAATWALPENGAPETIAAGEGLAGQTVIEKRPLAAHGLPADYLRVGSSLGSAAAAHVVAGPLSADGEVVGVVELGFTGTATAVVAPGNGTASADGAAGTTEKGAVFGESLRETVDAALALLETAGEAVGVVLRGALYRNRLEDLLARTQQQAEELQVQQEELRVTNEELEERGRALMDSQARLETQQAELEQSNVQLEEHSQRLEQQKRHLLDAQQDLTENATALARASQYKSEFLANMSHELRTPLNSSLILAKLLQDNKHGNLSPEQVRYASTIYSSNTDLLSLINDILDLAKVEAGHMEVQPEPITVDAIIASLQRTFEPIALEKRLTLQVERAPEAPLSLTTDHQRLLQILKNLLSNAFKFTAHGGVTIRVSHASPAHLTFAIADTGIGIADEHLASIFEAFRQADGTTSRRFGGSGLGLSISRELAGLLGGDITVSSVLGEGSTFLLTLPVSYAAPEARIDDAGSPYLPSETSKAATQAMKQAAAQPTPPAAAAPAPSKVRQRPHSPSAMSATAPPVRQATAATGAADANAQNGAAPPPARTGIPDDRDRLQREHRLILVIEDDQAFAHILYDLAHELDFDCIHAATGEDGIRLAADMQPSGILLDVGLPDDSGLTVLERLKRDPKTRHLPIHMISANDHAEAALHLGAIGYSLKPTARDELVTAIQRLEERLSQRLRRVLVVEDDPGLRENIQLLLDTGGIEIDGVGTIADAMTQLSSTHFDCVVMDLTLPDGSGYDLLRDMAEATPHSYPPVIVYTGRSLTAEEERRLRFYSKSIIIKGAKSPERLLDEVTLFLHSVEAELPATQQRLLRQARQRDATFEGRTILLAEDDVRNIFALSHVIEPLGAKLEIARNGREAIEKLQSDESIDLVLMDIMMPEMDGLTAMREIRQRLGLDRLPIIALTAKAMSSDRERCLEAGANDYISKPIDVDKLLSLCRVWLSH